MCQNADFELGYSLTHLGLVSHKWDIHKQSIPRSTLQSAASDQGLDCLH